jgi:hypothetical protein
VLKQKGENKKMTFIVKGEKFRLGLGEGERDREKTQTQVLTTNTYDS